MESKEVPKPRYSWNGKTVLVVDDSPAVLAELKEIYEQIGMRVIGTAQNGIEALEKLKESKPDLVSLDIIMPEMHGIECYRKIKKAEIPVKCLFISCLANEPGVAEKFSGEIESFQLLAKPVTIGQLETRLSKLFNPEKDVKPDDEKPLP